MKSLVSALFVAALALSSPAADLSEFKTADSLWQHIDKMRQEGPTEHAQSADEHRAILVKFIGEFDTALVEFCGRFPSDKRCWDARLQRVQCANLLANLQSRAPDLSADEPELKEIAAAADAIPETRAQAAFLLVLIHAEPSAQSTNKVDVAAISDEVAAFEKSFPKDPRLDQVRLVRARLVKKADPSRAEPLYQALSKSSDPQVATEAKMMLSALQIGKQPLSLKFTATDGSTVDLEKFRGKVVMLDFWATWCGPCVVSMPGVVAAYGKYHDKGFEIVGISLDRDKDKLLEFTKRFKMPWPQYFDGKTWENEIGIRFGVNAIPSTWLVDKKGYVRPTEDGDLGTQVEALLAQ